jgi:AraC family transcriptional regulator of adaptative response/methylated-DNA-[protein]-cysteine methyltransferase
METAIVKSQTEISAEQGLQAIAARDKSFDGQLLYGVRSTGIYCRPSCPSRRPKPENVEFYFSCDSAEQAGYRACRRCKPREQNFSAADVEMVRRVCEHISQNLEGTLTLEVLSRQLGMSVFQLHRAFRRVMGISPREYAEARRLAVLKSALRFGVPVTDAIYQAGYGSSSRVYERSDKHLGMTPRDYRRGGEGMQISYTVAESPLGKLLVAGTEKGISAICIGDSENSLKRSLVTEYPRAEIKENSNGLRSWVKEIVAHLEGKLPDLDLPRDVRATAFQHAVWRELMKIPRGATRSYSEVARRMGHPKATRAVARACATNPTAIVVPCHRVVRNDGQMGGYRWGVQRKRQLLAQERSSAAAR